MQIIIEQISSSIWQWSFKIWWFQKGNINRSRRKTNCGISIQEFLIPSVYYASSSLNRLYHRDYTEVGVWISDRNKTCTQNCRCNIS